MLQKLLKLGLIWSCQSPWKTPILPVKKSHSVLAGVAQWIECWPANQRVAGSICIYGTCLGCRPGPQLGEYKRQAHIDISLLLFLLPFPSPKINK